MHEHNFANPLYGHWVILLRNMENGRCTGIQYPKQSAFRLGSFHKGKYNPRVQPEGIRQVRVRLTWSKFHKTCEEKKSQIQRGFPTHERLPN